MTISNGLNFGRSARTREVGLRRSENVWLRLTTASAQRLRLSSVLFHFYLQQWRRSCSQAFCLFVCLFVCLFDAYPDHDPDSGIFIGIFAAA